MDRDSKKRGPGRVVRAIVLGLLTLFLCAQPAWAAAPPGPRLATVELIDTKGSERDEPTESPFVAVTTFGPSGEAQRHLLKQRFEEGGFAPITFYGPSWSGDGSSVAIVGISGKRQGIYLIDDGGSPHLVKGTRGGANPVIAPDGTTLVFSRSRTHLPKPTRHGVSGRYYSSTTTWEIGIDGGRARRLTSWRNGLSYTPSSFSPDGSLLALTKRDQHQGAPLIALMRTDGGGTSELEVPGEEPEFSADGKQLAFVGYLNPVRIEAEENRDYDIGELYTMNLDGTQIRRLTRNKDEIETSPSWDSSGQRLAYVAVKADTSFDPGLGLLFPTGNAIEQVNVDGSCREEVRSSRKVALYGVAWQPGAERGAGRIEC